MNKASSTDSSVIAKTKNRNGLKRLSLRRIKPKQLINLGGSFLAIVIALSVASSWMSAPARPQKMARPQQAKQVDVIAVSYTQAEPLLQLHGEVMAAMSVKLYPQIAGKVISINGDLAPGTLVEKDQVLASIEQADYLLAVQEAKANLADARASFEQELGNQAVASRELKILMQQLKTELTEQQRKLILRKPQLAQAQAQIDSAQAALEESRLDLARTKIRAPFAGIISSKYVDQGSQLTTTTAIIDLIDTTAFWIKVSLPGEYLNHLSFANDKSGSGSKVRVYLGNKLNGKTSNTRTGELYKRLPELDSTTRQAQVLLRIDDPLALKAENQDKTQLMVNDYVAVDIVGNPLQHVVVLDESMVHNGNQVWIYQQGALRIHQLDIVWREQDRVIAASGVQEGDLLVTTNIANAYEGLQITTASVKASNTAADAQGDESTRPITLREAKPSTELLQQSDQGSPNIAVPGTKI